MDTKLDSLIEKIKKDGIAEAEIAAGRIRDKADREAEKTIEDARAKAEAIVRQAESEAEKIRSNAESSLRQAARDMILTLREKVSSIFDSILKEEIGKELRPEFLYELINKVIDAWKEDENISFGVLVNEEDRARLLAFVKDKIKDKAKENLDIGLGRSIKKGFRIGIKGQDMYYDFTDESILEALKIFLNPSVRDLISPKDNG